MLQIIDFWLSDFKWFRDLTENNNMEWICRHEATTYGGMSSKWERHPKGTYLIYQILQQVTKDYHQFNNLNQKEQRDIVQHYINKYYKNNGKEFQV